LTSHFKHSPKSTADWYLQARITQDAEFNITLDQYRYGLAIVRRYLPTAAQEPSQGDLKKYCDPLPREFQWTKAHNSDSPAEVKAIETEFGFKFREVTGSFNFLVNTAPKVLFAVRKACKFMYQPGRQHFKALRHLLHHLRCYPPQALIFYSDPWRSPLYQLLLSAGLQVDPSGLIYFTDSSFMDNDDSKSTGCLLGFYQAGLIDANSFVPPPVAMSTGEAKSNTLCVGIMCANHTKQILMELRYGNPDRPYTVPILIDSSAALAMVHSDKVTAKTRHVARRWQYGRHAQSSGDVIVHHINGDAHQLADIGTKNLSSQTSDSKLALMTLPCDADKVITPSSLLHTRIANQRGVMECRKELSESPMKQDWINPQQDRINTQHDLSLKKDSLRLQRSSTSQDLAIHTHLKKRVEDPRSKDPKIQRSKLISTEQISSSTHN
jgi:hypothetical protein